MCNLAMYMVRLEGACHCAQTLYMATVTVTCQNPAIRDFHRCLCRQGKSRKVAVVVAMCKLLPVVNVVLRDQVLWHWDLQPAIVPNEAAEQWLAG